MSQSPTLAKIGCFGKIRSRGDFIKVTDNLPLTTLLDNWLALSMDLLAGDPRWKLIYDGIKPLHFAFLGPRSKQAVAGHLIASADQAGRRFPFLAMSAIDVDDPYLFVKRSPLILGRLWIRLEALSAAVVTAADATVALQNLAAASVDLELQPLSYDAMFSDFLDLQSVGTLDAMLAQAGHTVSVRQLLLALGLLLQPVLSSSLDSLDKCLILPLPADPMYRYLVASFWMHLTTPFLKRADFELALFFTVLDDKPCMILGFSGASPRTLHAIMHPRSADEHHVAFEDTSWIEHQIDTDYGVKKLAGQLWQPGLTLKAAHDAFLEAFIGI